eukprot:348682_1
MSTMDSLGYVLQIKLECQSLQNAEYIEFHKELATILSKEQLIKIMMNVLLQCISQFSTNTLNDIQIIIKNVKEKRKLQDCNGDDILYPLITNNKLIGLGKDTICNISRLLDTKSAIAFSLVDLYIGSIGRLNSFFGSLRYQNSIYPFESLTPLLDYASCHGYHPKKK